MSLDVPFVAAPATLYVVATPIGNLRDITLRALDILRTADLVAAEDTRVTGGLLRHYGIAARTLALHEHNERAAAERVVERLQAGDSVAYVTDAGSPGLSDPGAHLVAAVRQAGLSVVPIPGPSALAAALSASGAEVVPFVFFGFLPPRASARRAVLEPWRDRAETLVCYESPHRIVEALDDMAATLGPQRPVTIARELTKRFESVHVTQLGTAPDWLRADPDRQRGEFVVIVGGAPQRDRRQLTGEALRVLGILRRELPASRAARIAAEITGEAKRALYAATLPDADDVDNPADRESG